MKSIISTIILLLCVCLSYSQNKLAKDVVSNGASYASNSDITIQASLGQAFIGMSSSSNTTLAQGFWSLQFENTTSVVFISEDQLSRFEIGDIYPNPSPGAEFSLPVKTEEQIRIKMSLHDQMGKLIASPIIRELGIGRNEIRFDLEFLPRGSYYLRISDGEHTLTRQLHVIN